jgi:hypothetical protein
MTATWADVGLALAGAPVGAAIAVFGIHLTNRANAKRAAAQAQEERTRDSHAQRLAHRDKLYLDVMTAAHRLYVSIQKFEDYQKPNVADVAALTVNEGATLLYGSLEVHDFMMDFADQCFILLAVLDGSQETPLPSGGTHTVLLITKAEAYKATRDSYPQLVFAIRRDLGLPTA